MTNSCDDQWLSMETDDWRKTKEASNTLKVQILVKLNTVGDRMPPSKKCGGSGGRRGTGEALENNGRARAEQLVEEAMEV